MAENSHRPLNTAKRPAGSPATPAKRRTIDEPAVHSFLEDGGTMGRLMRAHDWTSTPVGPPERWPQTLQTAVSMMLNSSFPMFIWWGADDLTYFYNDANIAILGNKHPGALGRCARDILPEMWSAVGPMVDRIFSQGQAIYRKDQPLRMNRHGFNEDAYFTFSGSPIKGADGRTEGLFCVITETTEEVSHRRLLQEYQSQLEAVFQSARDGIGVFNMDGDMVLLNDALARMNGFDDTSRMQRRAETCLSMYRLIQPDNTDLPASEWPVSRALRGDAFTDVELRAVRTDNGQERYFSFSGGPVYDDHGTQSMAVTITRDITKRKKAEAELRASEHNAETLQEQQAQLIALNQAKDEFISLASHQLRTPATGVKQYLGMLLGDFAGELSADQRELTQHAYDSNERQLGIVTDLLSVAQADAGKIDLHKQPVDLVQLIDGILDEQASKFIDRRQTVTFRHTADTCRATIDRGRMRMVLENLVDNASKYTHEGKKIRVTLSMPAETKVRIAIKDEGVGIGQEDIDAIFNKFIRADNPLSDVVGGSGLGLYLAKKIVELHDGSIRVASTPGKGSTFTISLPTK